MSIHVAITRRVLAGREQEFQQALREFFKDSYMQGGVIGATMIVPAPDSGSREYGIMRTFASEHERDAFYASATFKAWEDKARTMTENEPAGHRDLHGLEAWFRDPNLPRPPKWKMALATLVGVYPTSLLLGTFVAPHLHGLPRAIATLVIGICMVFCLTWLVMPLVTKLLHHWLHPSAGK